MNDENTAQHEGQVVPRGTIIKIHGFPFELAADAYVAQADDGTAINESGPDMPIDSVA